MERRVSGRKQGAQEFNQQTHQSVAGSSYGLILFLIFVFFFFSSCSMADEEEAEAALAEGEEGVLLGTLDVVDYESFLSKVCCSRKHAPHSFPVTLQFFPFKGRRGTLSAASPPPLWLGQRV
jgi:hypothetical protein